MKQSLKAIEEEKKRIFDQKKLKQELTLVVTNLEDFSSNITSNLDNADWITKRDIIRTLVKRIEINLGMFKKVCQTAFLVQLNFQSIRKENAELRHS
ncbi:uncharacterized protein TNCT_439381 [Trichonephila clavata]|nr:uncharacterized protein TNCT_439381 [Trichonephila clavata]